MNRRIKENILEFFKKFLWWQPVLILAVMFLLGACTDSLGIGKKALQTNPKESVQVFNTEPTSENSIDKNGKYTSKDEVALYIHTYGQLPSNYITKSKAQEKGWNPKTGNLNKVLPGMSIGGSVFGNYDEKLPQDDNRKYYECDIDYTEGFRNSKRLVYSNDGLIFYTDNHYETFEQLY